MISDRAFGAQQARLAAKCTLLERITALRLPPAVDAEMTAAVRQLDEASFDAGKIIADELQRAEGRAA